MIFDEAKSFLKKLIKIDSVEKEAVGDKPFGEGVAECLDVALAEMERNGFKVKNGDYFYGYGEVGEGDLFGVLSHLDVVPIGSGWTHDPFGAEEADNKVFGRGALDDKGPYAAALYAAIKLLREGNVPKKRLRFIVGCDEESGWRCMDHYKECEELPKIGISPDSDFPVINCEKGIVYHTIKCPLPQGVVSVEGGDRANMVPNYAKAVLNNSLHNESVLLENGVDFKVEDDLFIVETAGKNAHGSHPEQGDNALIKLLDILSPLDANIKAIHDAFCDYTGKNIGLDMSDDVSGSLTLNLGCAKTVDNEIVFELDIRHPVKTDKDKVTEIIKEALPVEVEQGYFHNPLYVPKDSPLVKTLLESYEEVTGEKAEPIAIGGGTYARCLPLGVAFGPCFPNGNSGMHCPDEYMDLDDFKKMINIYYVALKKLCF